MIYSNALGYVFEAKDGRANSLATVDNYKFYPWTDHIKLSITCGIDTSGVPLIPAYINIDKEFVPLTTYDKELEVFVAGNKRVYSKFGEFMLLVDAVLAYDSNTGEYLPDKSEIGLYLPKHTIDNMGNATGKNDNSPAVVCEKLSPVAGLHLCKTSENMIEGYKKLFIKHHDIKMMEERLGYLKARCERF